MKILVTGNKGFIATYLIEKLEKEFPMADIKGFEIEDNVYDFCDEHYDVIFHLAAIARIVDCTEDPFGQPHASNVELTRILLKYFSFDKFIYTSSCVVYGDELKEFGFPFTENSPTIPNSIYSSQKFYSENLINFHLKHIGKPSVSLRLFNVYGPRQSQLGNYPNVIAALIKKYKETGYAEITGNGFQSRDFVYVEDVATALIKSLQIEKGNHIFNVCSGEEYSINFAAKLIADDKIKYIPERPFDIYKMIGRNDKIRKTLNWKPEINFQDGIYKTLKYEGLI